MDVTSSKSKLGIKVNMEFCLKLSDRPVMSRIALDLDMISKVNVSRSYYKGPIYLTKGLLNVLPNMNENVS